MKIKPRYVYIVSSFFLICLAILFWFWMYKGDTTYKMDTIRTDTGWGYSIRKNDQVIIYQEYIPAQEGKKSFNTRRAAKKTGKLVVKKLTNNELPGITKDELEAILSKDR